MWVSAVLCARNVSDDGDDVTKAYRAYSSSKHDRPLSHFRTAPDLRLPAVSLLATSLLPVIGKDPFRGVLRASDYPST